jgi:hypothetical protein
MLTSASALILAAVSTPGATDVTPSSLAIDPPVVEFPDRLYDWTLQQGRAKAGAKLAITGNCYTHTATNNNGQADQSPDCGLD